MNIPYVLKRRLISVYLFAVFCSLIAPSHLYGVSTTDKKNSPLASPPGASVYTAPDRNSRISATAIGNYVGSGLALNYEKIFTSYFHLTTSLAYTQALLKGKVSANVEESITSNMTRAALGLRFFLKKRFYFGTSINVSLMNGDYSYKETIENGANIDIPFQTQLIHGDIYFGNEWLLKHHIHIGIDWIGFGFPFVMKINDKASAEDNQALEFLTQKTVHGRLEAEIIEQIKLFYFAIHVGYRF